MKTNCLAVHPTQRQSAMCWCYNTTRLEWISQKTGIGSFDLMHRSGAVVHCFRNSVPLKSIGPNSGSGLYWARRTSIACFQFNASPGLLDRLLDLRQGLEHKKIRSLSALQSRDQSFIHVKLTPCLLSLGWIQRSHSTILKNTEFGITVIIYSISQ